MMGALTRRIAIAAAVVALVGVVARIAWVNLALPHISFEQYGMGEWVPLDGSFLYLSGEGTKDYSIRVDDVQVMTVDEYRRAYDDGTEQLGVNGDARCLVVVTLSIKNDGKDQGGFAIPRTFLVPQGSQELYYFGVVSEHAIEPLHAYDGPETEDSYARGWGIEPGTECQVHLAYLINRGSESINYNVTDTDFELYLSLQPTCKTVSIDVGGEADA